MGGVKRNPSPSTHPLPPPLPPSLSPLVRTGSWTFDERAVEGSWLIAGLLSRAGSPLTVAEHAICGGGAGLVGAFIVCPTELIKCRLQAISKTAPPVGPTHVTRMPTMDMLDGF